MQTPLVSPQGCSQVLVSQGSARKLKLVWCLSLLPLLLLGTGCHQGGAQSAAPPPPTVTVEKVLEKELVEWEEFTGRTEAVEMVEVRPRVSGHIQEVRFQAGQRVKKGDVLFLIDPRWHQAEMDGKHAEYEQARVRLETAEREAGRTGQLLEKKAIAIEEAEARRARFLEAKAALLAAEAARDTARLDLENTEIRSPIDGQVSRALVTAGNYVTGGAGAGGAATVLTTIVSVDPIYVYAGVDENSLLKIHALVSQNAIVRDAQGHIPVELQLSDEKGFLHRGHVESFDNRLDPQTGSMLVRAVFPNPEGRIVPGLFARIRVPASAKHGVLLVDERAIGTDQAQKFVLTLTPTNTVAYRRVELGPVIEGKRIVRSGLLAGETIVVNGLQHARPGMEVTAVEAGAGTVEAKEVRP